jgi:hypothetical protein
VVVHTCNPSIWEAEAGRYEFNVSRDYIARPCLKITIILILKRDGLHSQCAGFECWLCCLLAVDLGEHSLTQFLT